MQDDPGRHWIGLRLLVEQYQMNLDAFRLRLQIAQQNAHNALGAAAGLRVDHEGGSGARQLAGSAAHTAPNAFFAHASQLKSRDQSKQPSRIDANCAGSVTARSSMRDSSF